jgi:hypothetical protein
MPKGALSPGVEGGRGRYLHKTSGPTGYPLEDYTAIPPSNRGCVSNSPFPLAVVAGQEEQQRATRENRRPHFAALQSPFPRMSNGLRRSGGCTASKNTAWGGKWQQSTRHAAGTLRSRRRLEDGGGGALQNFLSSELATDIFF